MMTPRGNLAPWSFNNGRGISQIESFTELLKTEKRAFDSKNVFAFDPDWEDVSPFILGKDGFFLRVNIGGNTRIFFPPVLNSRSPIKIRTRNNTVKQYLSSGGTYRGELVGRYLVYRGKGKDILYRYDTDSNELREFVYVPTKDSLNADGEVIRWRFEGAKLSLENNGNARLIHSRNPSADLAKLGDDGLQSRISRFLEKRNQPLGKGPIEKTLFVIPRPEYVDGKLDTLNKGINYQVVDNQLTLVMDTALNFTFPLWVDPSLRADADADVILNGQSAGDSFGFSVASAGDFNGDGIDDIIVGAVSDDNNSLTNSGSAFIFFGGITGTKRADADADVILNGESSADNFGGSVASAGDFNGDGKDDVIVGSQQDSNNSGIQAGRAFIFFGGITGTKRADVDADVILEGQSAGDIFGRRVSSAGDFNGDGKDDVIISAIQDSNNSENLSGSAFIFFGGITGTKRADADADVIINGQSANDSFGTSLASAGDFNGDGKDDVIISAPDDDNNSLLNSGSAFIFFGGITGTKRADADADVIINGQSRLDRLGTSVASAGDFNGDGKDDVIIGVETDDNNSEDTSGSAFIFFGGITGTKRADTDADVILDGQSAGDKFGRSVASAGDFNGDGKDDVIVSAIRDDNNSETDSGSAFIFFGGITGTKRADADADVIFNGQSAGNDFGGTSNLVGPHLSAGDFNGDGTSDIIVGAAEDDNNSASNSGSAFIFFSSGVFPSVTFSDSTSIQSEDVTEVTIPVTLSKTSSSTVTVDFAVTSTATGGGVDYTLANGALSFSAGTTT
ncbi:integrin alpha, partial [Nitrospinae bacterium]|nr:integrin alpha [Nitrospinota bacterium]